MNWKRGFLRLWIVASLLWITAVSWNAYSSVTSPRMIAAAEDACFQTATKRKHGPNPFDCFKEGVSFGHFAPLKSQLVPFLLWHSSRSCFHSLLVWWLFGSCSALQECRHEQTRPLSDNAEDLAD